MDTTLKRDVKNMSLGAVRQGFRLLYVGMQGAQVMKKAVATGILVLGCVLVAMDALADTVYYGGIVKGKENPADIVFDTVKVASKYHAKLPKPNDPKYYKILQKRNDSVAAAVKDVAGAKGYDVVVEKGDPQLKGSVDITKEVIKQLKENEK